jgi:uncharacterized damage-inducible protein DinB
MKKLSVVFMLLALTFVGSKAFAQLTREQVIAEWQRAQTYTKAYLDAMPEDGYTYKATPEIRSFAQQMLHLADANYFFASTASGIENPLGKTSVEKTVAQTKAATIKAVMESYDFMITAISQSI